MSLFGLWPVLLPPWLSPGNNSSCREASGAALPVTKLTPQPPPLPSLSQFPPSLEESQPLRPRRTQCPPYPVHCPTQCEGGLCATRAAVPSVQQVEWRQAALRGHRSHWELGAVPAARAEMEFPLLSRSSWPLIRSACYLPAISLPAALCPGSNHRVNE